MQHDEYDELLRRVDSALQGIDGTLKKMAQQLDRTDATHAGISATLVRIGVTMEKQTAVLQQFATTLDRWVAGQHNGP